MQCVAEVASKTLTAEAPSYELIMELDRKVREFPIPPDAAAMQEDLETPPDSEPPPLQESMIRFVLAHSREVSEYCPASPCSVPGMLTGRHTKVLLFLHRSFFAQAIMDCPRNPLRSAYAHSFLAAYRSSCTILKVVKEQFGQYPGMCARFWVIWTFAFSSAVSRNRTPCECALLRAVPDKSLFRPPGRVCHCGNPRTAIGNGPFRTCTA